MPVCITCTPLMQGAAFQPAERPCQIEYVGTSFSETQLCQTFSIGGGRGVMPIPRGFEMSYAARNHDIVGDSFPFFAGPGAVAGGPYFQVRYYLTPAVNMYVDPCHPAYCNGSFPGVLVLCRAMLCHLSGKAWDLWCNPLIHGPQGGGTPNIPELMAPRPISFSLDDNGQIGLIHFTTTGGGHCFPFEEQFCFTKKCGPTVLPETVWECLGSEEGGSGFDQLTDLDRLLIQVEAKMSEDQDAYPMFNPADVVLKNQTLAMLGVYLDQLDINGHDNNKDYDDVSINRWTHLEDYTATPPPGDPRLQPPPVTVDGTRTGTPVDIQCQIAHTNIYLPAELTLHEVIVGLNMSVESAPGAIASSGSGLSRRMLGNIDIDLTCDIKLKPEAYDLAAPFKFMFPDKPLDLRLEDPDNPGQQHPNTFLIPRGPDGCRVPLALHWRGIRGYHPFAKEPTYQNVLYNKNKSVICRGGIQVIHGSTFFGEVNRHYDPAGPQRYDGSVTVMVESEL